MLEPLQPEAEMPVNITMPENVKPSDALSDAQIKAKMTAPAPTEAEARAALERMVSGESTMTQQTAAPAVPEAVTQPQAEDQTGQPAPAETQPQEKVEVPQKFQTQDGKVDVQKVEKATLDAEAALKNYREKEAELKRKMNEVHKLKQQVAAPIAPAAPTQEAPQTGLPQGITQEMVDDSIKKNGPGWTLLRLAEIAKEQAKAEMEARFASIEERETQKENEAQLREIARADKWVLSDEGMAKLFALREQYPELNQARYPMQAAYEKHLALEVLKQRQAGQVQTPTPTPAAAKAPPTPVAGVRPVVSAPRINVMDDNAVNAHAKTLSPKEAMAFYENVMAQRGIRITRK